jgi:Ca2+-transporting ATPase
VPDITKLLESGADSGITSIASHGSHIHRYDSDVLPDRAVRSFLQMLVEAVSDQTLLRLIGCTIFILLFETGFASTEQRSTAWIDGTAILIAVCIVSFVHATSNHKQQLQFVTINRTKSLLGAANLVLGDVVMLAPGDCISADGLLVKGEDVKVDGSIACGESEAASKSVHSDPFLFTTARRGLFIACRALSRYLQNEQYSQRCSPLTWIYREI